MRSKLESKFQLYWNSLGGPFLTKEYKFHPVRRWRFDFCIPADKVAIEIEGGVWSGGRHTSGVGFCKDAEKYNTATKMGWAIIRLTPDKINTTEIEDTIAWLKRRKLGA